jgi:DnaJ-class molecular chaperone
MEFRDYYQTLGVSKNATDKDIKAAFRKLARKYHPDINPGDKQAEERFKEVNEAYEVLSDPEKRRKYDELGANWKYYDQIKAQQGAPGAGGFGPGGVRYEYRNVSPDDLNDLFGGESPFSDFFNTFFGGSASGRPSGFGGFGGFGGFERQARSRKGGDLEHAVDISLEESFSGTTRTVRIQDASGRTREVEVKVPAGVRDGMRVRAAGQGEQGEGRGASGDLYLRVRVRPHPSFERNGDDLRTKVAVPWLTCILGGEVNVPTLTGRVALKVPPETQNGRVFRLRGQGMRKLGAADRGDLYVEVKAMLPDRISPEQRRLLEELARLERASRAGEPVGGGVR